MRLVEGDFCGHPHKAAQSPFRNQRILPQFFKLRFCQIFEPAMGKSTYLPEGALLNPLIDGQSNGKQRGKQHRCQGDSQNGHDIPGTIGQQGP